MTGPTIETGAPPSVPGLVLDRRLGVGRHGEVWRGLDLGAVRAVAVQVGRPAGGAGAAAREAALLRRIDHENVAHLRSVVDLPDGRRAIVLDLVPGSDLAALVAHRGPLTPGEVVTLAIGLARGLEQVHGLGFVHGRLSPHHVLFAADGRPVLVGVGVDALLARPAPEAVPEYPTPQDDVLALGKVLRFALSGGRPDAVVPGPLGAVVALCLAADPASRPSPTRVATLAWGAAVPIPVALDGPGQDAPGPAEPPVPAERSRRPVAGGLLVAGAVLAVGVVLAGALVVALRVPETPAQKLGQEVPLSSAQGLDDVSGLLQALAAARARALAAASEPELAAVDAPASAALATDTAFLRRVRRAGVTLSGLGFAVGDAHVLEASDRTAVVQARVSTSAYREVRADGSIARRVPAGAPRTVRLTLVRTAEGWRISADG